MDPPAEQDLVAGQIPGEKNIDSNQKQTSLSEHSSQQSSGNGVMGLVEDSLSSLSVSAEPFKSTSLEQSTTTQLSVFAKEFVPKTVPATVYTESYEPYGVQKLCQSVPVDFSN